MSSNILLLGDCTKVDCVLILTDSLTFNTVMGSSKNSEEHCKSHRTSSVKINVFGPITNQMAFKLWTL